MSNKFSNEEIEEIVSKLKIKKSPIGNYILLTIVLIIIILIILLILLFIKTNKYICLYEEINTKINELNSKINNSTSSFENRIHNIHNIVENNATNIRYLISTSGKQSNNSNLLDRNKQSMPLFSNETDNPLLYTALNGN